MRTVIEKGWPETKQDVPTLVLSYFNTHDELAILDGLVFRGEGIVVPEEMRPEMKKLCRGHMLELKQP